MKQQTFASLNYTHKKKQTRREKFLEQMERCIPWQRFEQVIAPHYHVGGGRGGQPYALDTMLRIHLMAQWFGLSDPAMEDALYEIESIRRFAGIELGDDRVPDETTILNFRHLLERHDLGADVDSAAAHSVTVTAAKEADISELPKLLRASDEVIFGDAGYASDEYKRGARHLGLCWRVNDKGKPKNSPRPGLSATQRKRNRKRSSIRARVEHLFRIIKCQFGYRKVRYKGLSKNRNQVMTLMGLADLYQLREPLAPKCAQNPGWRRKSASTGRKSRSNPPSGTRKWRFFDHIARLRGEDVNHSELP